MPHLGREQVQGTLYASRHAGQHHPNAALEPLSASVDQGDHCALSTKMEQLFKGKVAMLSHGTLQALYTTVERIAIAHI